MIVIAGPCVIESWDILEHIASSLEDIAKNPQIDFYFKASFDKANRTSLESYRGVGLEMGMDMLSSIKKKFGYKILSDIHESYQAGAMAEVCDVIQIPAFLCRQTDLIVSVAKTEAIVNIKKGQFMNPKDMRYSVLKALKTRGVNEIGYENSKLAKVWLTERGNTFGYGNLVVDMRSLPIMNAFAPVIFDATHSVQMPGGGEGKSSGDSSFAPILARSAFATGACSGLFAEVHTNPQKALSDGPNMITPSVLKELLHQLIAINQIAKGEI